MASIIVWHEETKKQFKLADALLIAPAFTVINAKEGTVWRNDFNSINTFNGQFLQAVPGKNTLYYTGAAGKIEIIYTNRWFIWILVLEEAYLEGLYSLEKQQSTTQLFPMQHKWK